MVIDLGTLVGVITAVFGLIIILVSAVAVMRATWSKDQIEQLRTANKDLRDRVGDLENDNKRISTELGVEKEARRALESVVTGKALLEKILERLNEHDKRAVEIARQQGEFVKQQEATAKELRSIRSALAGGTK